MYQKLTNIDKAFNDWRKEYETKVILCNYPDSNNINLEMLDGLNNVEKLELLNRINDYKHERAKDFKFISMN
jgi:cell division protein FtsX